MLGLDGFKSLIQCGVFRGANSSVFLEKREYDGPIWKQIHDAHQFVLRNIRLAARIEGVFREDYYELPPDSIRELIVNAIVHCSFLQMSHVQVSIYDDRLEITSPGGLMSNMTIEKMKEGYSLVRNKALAHAFLYMHLIEGWGTGIPRLLDDMKKYGLHEPKLIEMENSFRVVLCREKTLTNKAIDSGLEGRSAKDIDTSNVFGTSEEIGMTSEENNAESAADRILDGIRGNPVITQRQLADIVGLSYSGVRYVMEALRKEGILERVGSTKTGKWIIKKN